MKSMRTAKRQNPAKRRENGVQLLELAIVTPVFLFLLLAIAEFGQYYYLYNTLAKATRVGARYLSARVYTASEQTKARNLVVCGSLSACAGGTAILPNLTTSNISIATSGGTTLFPQTITVSITGYTYTPLFDIGSFVGGPAWANVAVSPGTTMRYMLEN